MIENDKQLAVVRSQLERMDRALDALHREVHPQNPKMYELMAESYIAEVLKLRGEIDAYLGFPSNSDSQDPQRTNT